MKSCFVSAICLILLAGCSEKAPVYKAFAKPAELAAVDVAEMAPNASRPAVEKADLTAQAQIAYTYAFGFRISSDRIAELQKTHTALCEAMGPKCRVLRTSLSNNDGDGAGEVKLQVSAAEAGALEKRLVDPATKLGGELVSSEKEGEDLSKTIVDTEAKLQSRLVLRGKLTDILRNNKGSVDELIKAEKAVADVNEEIDTSASELQGYRSRIRFSDVSISYQPTFGETQLGFARPIMTAAGAIGTTLGMTIAGLIYVLTALVPIVLFVLALRWVLHRFGLRIRFWRKAVKVDSEGA